MSNLPFTIYKKAAISLIFVFVCLLLVGTPFDALAQDSTGYEPLEPIPTVELGADGTITMSEYIPGIIKLIIGIAGVLAVVKIIFGGILYMSTDAIGGKTEGKSHIQNALWGLLLIISSWMILYTINPKLVEINLSIESLDMGDAYDTEGPTIDEVHKGADELGCNGCVAILDGVINPDQIGTSRPKTPGYGCAAGIACYVYNDLADRLIKLTESIDVINYSEEVRSKLPFIGLFVGDWPIVEWQVTEMFPPTRPHSHPCHKANTSVSGQCVDAALRNLRCANQTSCSSKNIEIDAIQIQTFIQEAQKQRLHVVYETSNDARTMALRRELERIGVFGVAVITPKYADGTSAITNEHFSVYLNQSVYTTRNE